MRTEKQVRDELDKLYDLKKLSSDDKDYTQEEFIDLQIEALEWVLKKVDAPSEGY
jgi:hypothetical protein